MSIEAIKGDFWNTCLLVAAGMISLLGSLNSASAASNKFNLESADYSVAVISADPQYGGIVLELANQSFKYFSSTMGIKDFGPFQFLIVLEETSPAQVSLGMEGLSYPRSVILGSGMQYRIDIPSRDFNPIAVVRTLMIAQLQASVLKSGEWKSEGAMPAAPFWLVEGLTQGVLDKKTPDLEKIIARIDRQGPVPSLETVQSWQELSPHRLEQWWQEACCYWLVKKATASGADREAIYAWLVDWFSPGAQPYWDKNAETEVWWKKTLGERGPDKSIIAGEEQTRQELLKCLQFQARLKGEAVSQDFNLAKLPKPPLEFASAKPFDEVMKRLLLLQARGHFLWQDVIESYRTAYALWLKGKYNDYLREVAQAEAKAQNVVTYISKTRDYLNWYEVNHPGDGPKFSTILRDSMAFQDTQDMERRDQAGIAAKLTQIEGSR